MKQVRNCHMAIMALAFLTLSACKKETKETDITTETTDTVMTTEPDTTATQTAPINDSSASGTTSGKMEQVP